MQASLELFETANVLSLMSADEARTCIDDIRKLENSKRVRLLELYERRGWAALGYATWEECCSTEFPEWGRTYIHYQVTAGEIERRLTDVHHGEHPIPERQLRPLAALTPMEQPLAWQEANERSGGKPTARVVEDVVKEMRADPVNDELDPPMEPAQAIDIRETERKPRMNAGMFTSATPEWYTPAHIVDRVEAVFGVIDLDPCSNAKGDAANVPALDHYTADDDGLARPWRGKVYMNPPYGDTIGLWVDRLINAYADGEIVEAIALLPARTDTAWFQPLFDHHICFVRGRLRFSGAENSAPFPSVVIYLGKDTGLFHDWFHDLGRIK